MLHLRRADSLQCWLLPLGSVLYGWEPCCWTCKTHLSARLLYKQLL